MNPEQEKKIRQHGENLQAIFPATKDMDPVALCKKLRRLENWITSDSVRYCNSDTDMPTFERQAHNAMNRLKKILQPNGVPVLINSDPRGYALKIDDAYMREHKIQLERDMGGYGIIAPEIT